MKKSKQANFLKLYEPVHDRFERFCRARVYGEMPYEDLLNETLLVAFEKFDKLENDDVFLSFLCGISVRLLANSHRKNKAETSVHIENFAGESSDNPEKTAEVHLLQQAMTHLSEDQREAILLFEIAGFSIKEIAQIQETTEDAVKQRLRRGRARLTKILTFESEYKLGEERV